MGLPPRGAVVERGGDVDDDGRRNRRGRSSSGGASTISSSLGCPLQCRKGSPAGRKSPTASMSRTVRKPFEERASAEAKKLPAAQLTSTSSAASRDLAVATATHRSTSSGFLTSPWIPEMFLTPLECKSATAASRTAWRRPVTKTEAPWRPRTKEDEFFVEVERLSISMAWLSSLFFISPSLSRPSYQTASRSRGRYPRSLP